jgi:hypothetical protein
MLESAWSSSLPCTFLPFFHGQGTSRYKVSLEYPLSFLLNFLPSRSFTLRWEAATERRCQRSFSKRRWAVWSFTVACESTRLGCILEERRKRKHGQFWTIIKWYQVKISQHKSNSSVFRICVMILGFNVTTAFIIFYPSAKRKLWESSQCRSVMICAGFASWCCADLAVPPKRLTSAASRCKMQDFIRVYNKFTTW